MAPEKYFTCLAQWQDNGDVIAENSLLKMLSGGPVLMVPLVNQCSVSGAVFSFGIGEIGDRGVLCFEIINHNAYTQYQDKVKEYRPPPPPYLGKNPEKVFLLFPLQKTTDPQKGCCYGYTKPKLDKKKSFPSYTFGCEVTEEVLHNDCRNPLYQVLIHRCFDAIASCAGSPSKVWKA